MAGKHRAPSKTSKRLVTVAAAAAIPAVALAGFSPGVANAGDLDTIAGCESGGSYTAQNPSSTASGKYQFIDGTWKAYRGNSKAARAKDASPAEQEAAARRLMAAEGTAPWNASKSCWGGKSGPAKPKVVKKQPVKAEKKATKPSWDGKTYKAPKKAVKAPVVVNTPDVPGRFTPGGNGSYTVKSGDTLDELAKSNRTTVAILVSKNKNIVENKDGIYVGEKLHVS